MRKFPGSPGSKPRRPAVAQASHTVAKNKAKQNKTNKKNNEIELIEMLKNQTKAGTTGVKTLLQKLVPAP